MALHRVATLGEIPTDEGKIFEIEGAQIAVFQIDGKVHAIENACPHRGGPLGDGAVSGTNVICPWHGWQFDCKSGQSTVNPSVSVRVYPVSIAGIFSKPPLAKMRASRGSWGRRASVISLAVNMPPDL